MDAKPVAALFFEIGVELFALEAWAFGGSCGGVIDCKLGGEGRPLDGVVGIAEVLIGASDEFKERAIGEAGQRSTCPRLERLTICAACKRSIEAPTHRLGQIRSHAYKCHLDTDGELVRPREKPVRSSVARTQTVASTSFAILPSQYSIASTTASARTTETITLMVSGRGGTGNEEAVTMLRRHL